MIYSLLPFRNGGNGLERRFFPFSCRNGRYIVCNFGPADFCTHGCARQLATGQPHDLVSILYRHGGPATGIVLQTLMKRGPYTEEVFHRFLIVFIAS